MSYELCEKVSELEPYEPITGNYRIRLDANESFYSMPENIKREIKNIIDELDFNRYPDPMAKKLIDAFSAYYGIDPDNVTASNGSDEMLYLLSSAMLKRNSTVIVAEPDFSMYRFYSFLSENTVFALDKPDSLKIDVDELIKLVNDKNADMVIFSNPCNPTSLGLDRAAIRKIVESLDDVLVILDEAYMDFWDQSILSEVNNYDNLIILKTCSKAIGLAAVRFGFAVANKIITNAIRAAKSPYNNDTVAQTIVADILSEKEYLKECRDIIVANTKKLYSDITEIDKKYGCFEKVYEPCTNFVFIKTDEFEKIYSFMLENSIAIRKFKGFIRITAGTEAENARFINVLERYFSK